MHARGQGKYQVRFGWGVAGAARIVSDAHLIVWVDVLPPVDAEALPRAVVSSLPGGSEVVLGTLGNAEAIADRAMDVQRGRAGRCIVAVVAAGIDDGAFGDSAAADAGEMGDLAGPPDFAVEDLLGAGAVIDALAARGMDHTSPEAAVACAAFTGLRGAIRHLVSASCSAAMLESAGKRDGVRAALAAGPELVVMRSVCR